MLNVYTHFKNASIKYKMLALILFNTIVISIISVIGLRILCNSYNNMLYNAIAGNLSFSSYSISEKLESIGSISSTIISSTAVQEQLVKANGTTDPKDISNLTKQLNNELISYYTLGKNSGVAYMILYNDHFSNCTNWALLKDTNTTLVDTALHNGIDHEGGITWTYGTPNDYLILTRHIREIADLNMHPIGNLLVAVNMDQIVSDSNAAVTQYENSHYIITTQDGHIIYNSKDLTSEESNFFLTNTVRPFQLINHNGKTYFSVLGTLPNYDYKYISLISFDSISNNLKLTFYLTVLGLFLGIGLITILADCFIQSIIKQFNVLIQKMMDFSNNEIITVSATPDVYRKDELGQLHRQFDLMADRIQHLVQDNYVNEILRKDAKLKALESQINPHFLYNTLESINWHAKASGEKQISQLVEALGNLLRATLSNKKSLVTLQYELELARSYMTIEKIRYENHLIYSIQVEDNLTAASVPPLVIQPLLENAIKYGLEEMTESCHISVSIQLKESNLLIQVRNEGSRFEPDLIEKLKKQERSPQGFGIGLANIDERIKILFGQDYGLTLSNEAEYAVATITIPFQKEV